MLHGEEVRSILGEVVHFQPGNRQPFRLSPSQAQSLGRILDGLRHVPGVLATVLTRRDGGVVLDPGGHGLDPEVLGSMSAAFMGAGAFVLSEISEDEDVRVIARTDTRQVHISGVGPETLLVTLADASLDWSTIKPHVSSARQKIHDVLEV